MFGLFALALTIGLADSINPTTVAPAIYIATTPRARASLVSYTLGIFVVYFLGGVLITFGPGQLILSIAPHPHHTLKHWLEIAVGVIAAVAALVVWLTRHRIQARVPDKRTSSPRSAFVLGATITAVELPTAFPYFAVIAAIVGADVDDASQVIALAIFNVAFVTPMLVLIWLRQVSGEKGRESLVRFGDWFQRNSAKLLAVLLAGVSIGFFAVGAIGLSQAPPCHGKSACAKARAIRL